MKLKWLKCYIDGGWPEITWHCLYPCCNHICTADVHPEKPEYQRELAEYNGKKNLNGLESKGSGGYTSLSHPSQCGQSLAWDPGPLGPWSLIQRTKVKAHKLAQVTNKQKQISRTGQKIHCKMASSRPHENGEEGSNRCSGLPYMWLKRRRNLVDY